MKPRIKLAKGPAVLTEFRDKRWRCFGPSPDGRGYGVGYGVNPSDAYYNWHIDLIMSH